jgi:phospholipase/carboxylesterase
MLDERLLIVSARAPFEFEYGGYTWFAMGGELIPDPVSFRESCDRLYQFLLDVRSGYNADPSRVFLFGFSMGTIMSYAMSLTKPELVRGVAANSGCIPEGTHLTFRWQELQNVSFFVTHGTYDSVLPVTLGRRSAELLKTSNARFTYREYPADHQLTDEGMKEVAEWMGGLLQ